VLSACDTATELRDSAGDEVVSLASSFALAGSPTVVASLWEISDDSTAELMATFYRALEKDKGDRLEALRAAKLNLLRLEKAKDRPYASPWHWASFQLYGDFRAPGAR
jgi:CHAT domain-containing protein